jgi:hypothetical protein
MDKHHDRNVSKEMINLQSSQKETLELKSVRSNMKNSVDKFEGRSRQAKKPQKNQTREIMASEEQKEKRMKKSDQGLFVGCHQADSHTHCGSAQGRKGETA